MKPIIGHWYRIQGSDSFEVVAVDDDDGTIELQYFDGTVEEMDIEDWQAEKEAGALEEIEPPEDWTGSVDVDAEDDDQRGAAGYGEADHRTQRAAKLEGLDLFEKIGPPLQRRVREPLHIDAGREQHVPRHHLHLDSRQRLARARTRDAQAV